MREYFYNYAANFTGLLNATVSNVFHLTTDSDSVFEVKTQQLCVSNGVDADSILAGNHFDGLYCTIYDTQVGRFLTGGKTPVVNIFGTAQYPNILPKSFWLMRRSVLEIQVYNETGYDIDSMQLVFSGIKHTVQGE